MNKEAIHALLGDRPIAYHPILAKAIGSVKAAVFLGQLLYWQGKGRWGDWTYKTADEFYEETGLSRREQETARKVLKEAGILEERLAGVPATLHFKADLDRLMEVLSFYKSANLDSTVAPILIPPSVESISEITQEITTPVEKSTPDWADLCRTTEEARAREGQWTTPQNGNGLVSVAVSCIYELLGSEPPKADSGTWRKLAENLGPVLKDHGTQTEATIRMALRRFRDDKPDLFDPWYKSFPGQLGIYLGRTNGKKVLKVGH